MKSNHVTCNYILCHYGGDNDVIFYDLREENIIHIPRARVDTRLDCCCHKNTIEVKIHDMKMI